MIKRLADRLDRYALRLTSVRLHLDDIARGIAATGGDDEQEDRELIEHAAADIEHAAGVLRSFRQARHV